MGLDELRARLDRLLGVQPDRRAQAAGLHDALLELKVAAGQSRDALAAAEQELSRERQHLADAERRGGLAAQIGDTETAAIAEQFTAKHRERIELLERKLAVIRDELAYVEREYQSLYAQLQSTRSGVDPVPRSDPLEESDRELDGMRWKAEREAREAAAKQQLDLLKRKMGKKE